MLTLRTFPHLPSWTPMGAQQRMPRVRAGQQRGLFDNPVGYFGTEELVAAALERIATGDPGGTAAQLAADILDELGIKPTRRAKELVAEAIRLARRGLRPRLDGVAGSACRAGEDEVRGWARTVGYATDDGDVLPHAVISAYNNSHPDRPF
jgi:hypothetical protein